MKTELVVRNSNNFAVNVYKKVAQIYPSYNFVFSPLAMSYGLSKLSFQYKTLQSHIVKTCQNPAVEISHLRHNINCGHSNIRICNKVFPNKKLVGKIPFGGEDQDIYGTLKHFEKIFQKDRIGELICAEDLKNLSFVLMNTFCLNDNVECDGVSENDFYVNPDKSTKELFFCGASDICIAEEPALNADIISFPLSHETALYIVMPRERFSLSSVESKLTSDILDSPEWQQHYVEYMIPRLEFNTVMDMGNVLKDENFHLEHVLENHYEDLGTLVPKAYHMTSLKLGTKSILNYERGNGEYKLDFPFLFYIKAVPLNAILAMGRYIRPQVENEFLTRNF